MDAYQFCAEKGKELDSGKITFSKKNVDKFIITYTYLLPNDFTKEARKRLVFKMIDWYYEGNSKYYAKDIPIEKIELPEFIFR